MWIVFYWFVLLVGLFCFFVGFGWVGFDWVIGAIFLIVFTC